MSKKSFVFNLNGNIAIFSFFSKFVEVFVEFKTFKFSLSIHFNTKIIKHVEKIIKPKNTEQKTNTKQKSCSLLRGLIQFEPTQITFILNSNTQQLTNKQETKFTRSKQSRKKNQIGSCAEMFNKFL